MSLSLRFAATVIRRDANPYQPDDDLTTYWRDLLAPFGIEADEQRLRDSPNIGFAELAEAALDQAPAGVVDPDLLLLAYALPDLHPLKSVTAHLNHLLGGRSRCFAISEQGLRAPFTALRVADAYARSGRCASLALFVCEQTTLAYHDPLVHDTPLVDSAALLYFDGAGGFTFRDTHTARGEDVGALAGAAAARGEGPVLVVAGPWVEQRRLAALEATVRPCPGGTYCTSVWLELARNHRDWAQTYRSVVLCDTDPRSGQAQVALLGLDPAQHPIEDHPIEDGAPR
jgi:hypothetical protein